MKLNGSNSYSCLDDGKDEEEEYTPAPETLTAAAIIIVGYALTAKKKKSFLKQKFILIARDVLIRRPIYLGMPNLCVLNEGIQFFPIDMRRPLLEQGPFNIILHKIEGKDWFQIIEVSTPNFTLIYEFDGVLVLMCFSGISGISEITSGGDSC